MYNFKNNSGKFRLHFNNVRYFVDDRKRTVTAVADVSVDVPEGVEDIIRYHQLPNGFNVSNPWDDIREGIKYSHTVTCSPDDEFDSEKGKKYAMAALEGKAYIGMAKRLSRWHNRLLDYVKKTLYSQVEDFIDKAVDVDMHDREYRFNLIGE